MRADSGSPRRTRPPQSRVEALSCDRRGEPGPASNAVRQQRFATAMQSVVAGK